MQVETAGEKRNEEGKKSNLIGVEKGEKDRFGGMS